jgi:hypothetical protein
MMMKRSLLLTSVLLGLIYSCDPENAGTSLALYNNTTSTIHVSLFSKGFNENTEGRNPIDFEDYVKEVKGRMISFTFTITDEDIENWK